MNPRPILIATCIAIALVANPPSATAQVIEIPDLALRDAIETALGKAAGAQITVDDMAELIALEVPSANISDLTVLERATHLTALNLEDNAISDISALSPLTQLTALNLGENTIADISVLSGLTQLNWLDLGDNIISDISPLSGLTKLTRLTLWYNAISDISALSGLTQLEWLTLWENVISDISPLSGLTQLKWLNLEDNAVSDISPLLGLTQLTELSLIGNPLSYTTIQTHILALQGKGVTVEFDPITPTTLLKISGDNQTGESDAALATPFVVEVQDNNHLALEGVEVTFTVIAGDGTLSQTTVTTDAVGRAESLLTLGSRAGTNTIEVAAAGIPQKVIFNAEGIRKTLGADVNQDGVVNILDLVLVAGRFDQAGPDRADVNGDGIVNILDLVLVANAFGDTAETPAVQ